MSFLDDSAFPSRSAMSIRGLVKTVNITPSAIVSTYGTAEPVNPDAHYFSFTADAIECVTTGMVVENLTVQAVVSFSDGTTSTYTTVITTDTTTSLVAVANLYKADCAIQDINFSCESDLAAGSSAAACAITVYGRQGI